VSHPKFSNSDVIEPIAIKIRHRNAERRETQRKQVDTVKIPLIPPSSIETELF